MIEQPEILKHDSDLPAHTRDCVGLQCRYVVAEQRDQTTRRFEGKKQKPEKAGFSRTRWSGQELERAFVDAKGDIPQHFRAHAIAKADIFESDQASLERIDGAIYSRFKADQSLKARKYRDLRPFPACLPDFPTWLSNR